MPQSPNVNFNDVDLTFSPESPALGITLFIGSCRRGPIGKPDQIFTSWSAFRRVHGGYVSGNNFPTGIKRALERGSAVRVCNVKHYSNITSGTLDGVKASAASSAMVSLSTALIAGVTLNVVVNGTTKSQLFSVSHENTLALLCAQIETLTAVVEDCYSQLNNTIIIVPKAGVTLTVTSTATGTGAPTITIATEAVWEDSSNNVLFALVPKYIGADYNNLEVRLTAASNGDADSFDIYIDNLGEPDLSEVHRNLKIVGKPTTADSTYLAPIIAGQYFDVTYSDLSAIVGTQINPRRFAIRYQSGTDGGAIVDADYIGDSASKTGFYSADQYDDFFQIATPEATSVSVIQAGAAYANARKDLQYFAYLGNFTTESALATARDNTLVDSKFVQFYAQSLVILNPIDSTDLNISCVYDVCGAADYSDGKFAPWWSFAGKNRGLIYNAKAVTNNFVTSGNIVNLNLIGNRQVNIIGNDGGVLYIHSNFTGQKNLSQYSFGNVTRFVIYIKKALGPYLKKVAIEEPNDIPTWKAIYLGIKPQFNNWADQRALIGQEGVGWRWQGDQFAKTISDADLTVNNANDVSLGKYKAKLFLKAVTAMQEMELDVVLTPSGVSFEEALSIVSPTN